MRQQHNIAFQNLLIRAKRGLLNNNNVDILNNRIACSISTNNINKNFVIIQQNKTRLIINRLQMKRFAQANRQNVILFSGHHSQTIKKGGLVVKDRGLLTI